MWQPDPAWTRAPGAMGSSTAGVWLAELDGRPVVVKRLVAPRRHDPGELSDPRHCAYWRRAAEVDLCGLVLGTDGLCSPRSVRVEEDDEGVTLVQERVDPVHVPGLFAARALGAFAGESVADPGWLARSQLRDRLGRIAREGGWRTLARTTVADVAEHLWRRAPVYLDRLDALPQVLQHGDPTPGNLPGRDDDRVVAVDWSTLGTGPVGADLGYLALGAREGFDPLVEAYLSGLARARATPRDVLLGARVTLVYTALSRAEWALARAATGQGALAGKYHHPSVAPYLRSLQRHFPQVEALVG